METEKKQGQQSGQGEHQQQQPGQKQQHPSQDQERQGNDQQRRAPGTEDETGDDVRKRA